VSVLPLPVIAIALVVLVTGCTSHAGRPTPRATASPSAASTADPVPVTAAPGKGTGCGDTLISPGKLPGWTADAGLPPDVPYAVSREANVVAVLFGYPLRAGEREDGRSNKILWEMRDPRNGKPLHLTARPLAGGSSVSLTREADSGPGEIYPSTVDVPTPGCWHMTLEWNGHTATIDLPYGP
jgi:hypothetical protein